MNATYSVRRSVSGSGRKIFSGVAAAICLILLAQPLTAIDAKAKLGRLPKDSVANNPIRTLDGQKFTLAELRGKVVVLSFFAIWCGHSKRHMPALTKYGPEYESRGLQIIGQAVKDGDSTPERVSQFIRDYKIQYPVGLVKDPVFSDYVDSKDVSVPQTLVYGRDGRLVGHFSGHDAGVESELDATIQRALNEK